MVRGMRNYYNRPMMMGADAYTFLMKELERVDEKILEPLSGTDWPRDMPVITGGGLVENVASIDVTYASSGLEEDNLFFDAANDIPVIQADMNKAVARTFNFAEYMSFSLMEKEKMTSVGRDPETFLNKGIRLHCDKVIDRNVYRGFTKVNSTGLCNHPRVMRVSAGTGASGSTTWATKTADEILNDVNTILNLTWRANDCASDSLPNHKVRLDIRPGDICLVFFCDVNTDGWESGNGGNGAARHHDLADGFAIVGFHTQNRLE